MYNITPGGIVILIPVLLFIVGLLFLSKGGDWFVDGASALARRFHLPVMLLVMLILTVPALLKGKLSRAQGMILLAIYAAFCVVQFTL